MTYTQPLSPNTLLGLAPTDIANFRGDRYLGDALNVSLKTFARTDQHIIQQLYQHLQALLQIVEAEQGDVEKITEVVHTFAQQMNWKPFVREVQKLGRATLARKASQLVHQVVHDIKSGSFAALVILMQLMEMDLVTAVEVQRLIFLARDHLLIMRNSVRDVDRERFVPDRQLHAQHIKRFTQAWANTTYTLPGRSAQVVFDSDFWGDISAAPIEFAALTRVFYNMLNNAVKYSNDEYVYVSLLRLQTTDPRDVRFVLYNRISAEHHAVLLKHYPNGLGELFRGGFTTGGSGIGMRTCAEHVAGDYGLAKVDQCIEGGYVGATYQHSYFVSWFHWPTAYVHGQ